MPSINTTDFFAFQFLSFHSIKEKDVFKPMLKDALAFILEIYTMSFANCQ